jgi:1,6-anhydro-N-acetylmuramate kinase
MTDDREGIRAKSEEALGELAQALLENPVFSQAVGRALGAGERAMQAQKNALGAIDVASAGDVERLTRRIRSLSDRVEELEDVVDDLTRRLAASESAAADQG